MISLVLDIQDKLFCESIALSLSTMCKVLDFGPHPIAATGKQKVFSASSDHPVVLLKMNPGSIKEEPVLSRIKKRFPGGKIILLVDKSSPGADAEALSCGIKGIFQTAKGGIEQLKKAIKAVHSGQIWAERETTSRLIGKLSGVDSGQGSSKDDCPELTRREKQILALVAAGLKNRGIGEELYISEQTVKVHMNRIFKKIKANDRLQAALYAIHNGLIPGKIPLK